MRVTRFAPMMLLLAAVAAVTVARAADAPTSAATPAPSARHDITLQTVRGLYATSIAATGRVQSLTSARVGPRVSGRLAKFGTAQDGQPLDVGMTVKAGQVLFELDKATFENAMLLATAQLESAKAMLNQVSSPARQERIEQIKQEVASLEVQLADKLRERDRYKNLVEVEKTLPARRLEESEVAVASLTAQKAAAQARLQEAQRGGSPTDIAVAQARVKEAEAALRIAQTDLRDAVVTAPFDGVITQRLKSTGDYLVNMPPTDVLEVVSMERLEAEIAIPESYLPAVQSSEAKLTLRSPLLRQAMELPVTRVVGQVDPAKGTFNVRVAIPADKRQGLIPGAFVTADLPMAGSSAGVIAPARALAFAGGKPWIMVARDGKMARQAVEIGDRLSEGVIITAGLKDGDRIIIGPAEQLADGRELPDYLK